MGDHEETPQIEYDDISMEAKFILKVFGGNFGTLTFDEKSFFHTFFSLPTIFRCQTRYCNTCWESSRK